MARRSRRRIGVVMAVLAACAAGVAIWIAYRAIAGVDMPTPLTPPPLSLASTTDIDTRPATRRPEGASATHAHDAREEAAQAAALDRYLRGRRDHPDPRQRMIAWYMAAKASPDLALRRRARAELARLRAASPDDPLIAMAQAWLCGPPDSPCTPSELDAWSQTEPGNAAAYDDALARAAQSPAQQDALLARMARADRHESRFHELALEVVAAFDDYVPRPTGPAERRLLREWGLQDDVDSRRHVIAAAHAWAMPIAGLHGVGRACRAPVPASRARDCRVVLMRMTRTTTLVERMIAFSLLERLARGTPEAAHWTRELQRLRWWSAQMATLATGPDYWQAFVRYGEVEAMRYLLLRAGRPLDPPPGWRLGSR